MSSAKMKRLMGGLSQNRLARELGMAQSTVNAILSGYREPGVFTAKRLADGMHVTLDAFVEALSEVYTAHDKEKRNGTGRQAKGGRGIVKRTARDPRRARATGQA